MTILAEINEPTNQPINHFLQYEWPQLTIYESESHLELQYQISAKSVEKLGFSYLNLSTRWDLSG